MDVESLAKELILKGMTPEQQKAVLDSIKTTMTQAREMQKQRIGENVQVVVQALKKLEADIRDRYDEVGNKIEKRVATIKDGQDGRNGVNGKDGKDGRPGRDGGMGPRGADGLNGSNGRDGEDGVSVTDAHIDFDGSLVISLSSGRTINVGEVVAPDLAEKIKVITNGGGTSQVVLDTLASLQTQINNLIPSQTGNAGKFLTTNGSILSWGSAVGGLSYEGTWNASTNTPTLASGVGTNGYYYVVATAGSTNLNGITDWQIGDWLIFNGTVWQKIDQSNLVTSVNGQTGAVSLSTTNISEGTNQYFTDTRARSAISAGTGISYNSSTGVVTNAAPDQTVALTGAGATTITGTYPNFTISSVNTTYSLATSTVLGLIELGSDTQQTVAPNAVSATASRSYALQVNAAGQGVVNVPWTDTNSGGTVTSVGGTGTVSGLSLSGTVTTSGNLTLGGTLSVLPSNFASQTANTVLAAPNGAAGVPTFRAIVAADIPTLNQNTTGTAANVTGTVAVANGGTGVTTSTGTGSVVLSTSPTLVTPALGTPSSGTVTNLTGTASININGTVGASTPNTGAFTTLSYTGTLTGGTGVVNIGSGQFYKDASGNVGIGTSSPTQKLSVSGGSLNVTGGQLIAGATAVYSDGAIGTPSLQTNATEGTAVGAVGIANTTANIGQYVFRNPNGAVGQISTSGSSTSYVTSSDYRLKDTITPMTGALDKVALLKPCTYKWKVDGSDGQGFIAHELAEVEPGCVTGEKDAVDAEGKPRYQGIDTSFLVATLTAAIQEQQTLITQLQADVAALKAAQPE